MKDEVKGKMAKVEDKSKEANQLERSSKEKNPKSRSRKNKSEVKTVAKVQPEQQIRLETKSNKVEAYEVQEAQKVQPEQQIRLDTKSKKVEVSEVQEVQETVSIGFKFVIGKNVGGGLYEGRMISPISDYLVSLIEPTDSQRKNIEKLRDVTASSPFLVTVNFLIEKSNNVALLVTEPVMPIDLFFQKKLETFQNLGFGEQNKTEWWNQIKDCFIEIFRDVVHGMIYLSCLDYIVVMLEG